MGWEITSRVSVKSEIEHEKSNPGSKYFLQALSPTNDEKSLIFTLDNLGKLPGNFDGSVFLPLLNHLNPKIRRLTVKNIGKIQDESFLEVLSDFASDEENTFVRREAVSALGRLKTQKTIPILQRFLGDSDPKIILQALRGLLYFKERHEVESVLLPLCNHPNELVREHASNELNSGNDGTCKTHDHAASSDVLKNIVVRADVKRALRIVPDESVHLTFTSPPYYNARDYTLFQSYETYLAFLTEVFQEVHRITKEGRFFILNTSPVIVPRISRAHSSKRYAIPYDIHPRLNEIGWEFIDDIVWVKPDYAAKNRNGGFFQHRKPLGYKSNSTTESVMVYRKKTEKLIDWNMRQYDENTVNASKIKGDYEKTNVWTINPSTDRVHPAVFPVELASRVIRFYSFKGDLIFDPFAGSGTVGEAAMALDRYFFLCEQESKYVEHIMARLKPELFPALEMPRELSLDDLRHELRGGGKKHDNYRNGCEEHYSQACSG